MIQSSTKKQAKRISLWLIIAAILFIGLLLAFYLIADEIVIEHEGSLDIKAFNLFDKINSDLTTRVMLFFTFFGSTNFLFPAYAILIIYYFFLRKNKKLALDVATVGLLGTGLLFLLKDVFKRQRPLDALIHASGYSFPSGHSFSAFTFFGLMIYMLWQTSLRRVWKIIISVLLILTATVVATSRIYLHVHYASDVLGGFCLSLMWLLLSLWVLHELDKKVIQNKI